MSAVVKASAHLTQLQAPAALRALPGWLMWRLEDQTHGKARKIPYYVNGARRSGVQGRPEDRAQLVTFEAAKAAAARRGFDGVGFAPMKEWGVCALDFDNCVQNGQVDPQVLDLVAGTYAEYSPSGNGVRAFVLGDFGNFKSLAVDSWGFETFSSSGFVTFTGNVLPDCLAFDAADTMAPGSEGVRTLCGARFRPIVESAKPTAPLGLSQDVIDQALEVLPDQLPYDGWLTVGMALHHETGGEGFEQWDTWSQRSPKYSTREYNLARWESFGKRQGGPEVTIRSLVHLANEHGARISLQQQLEASAFDDLTVSDTPVAATDGAGQAPMRFPVQQLDAFLRAPRLRYLVKGMLPMADLGVLYGEPGSGKSFAMLDLVMALCRGEPWRGLKTLRTRVVVIAAEGAGGMRNRVQAFCDFHGVDMAGLDLGVIADAPNFLLVQDVKDVIRSIQATGGAGLVVVDTLAQVTPGANENSGEDMGKALEHCRQIRKFTGAMVLLVHHSGKDSSKGARGWSGLKGACDVELEVSRDGDARAIRLSKLKDGEDGLAWGFKLNQVGIGEDEDGDPITSCVVEACEVVASKSKAKKQGDVQRLVARVLEDMQQLSDEGVHYDDLVAAAVLQIPQEEGKRDQRPSRVKRAVQLLQDAGSVVVERMRVRLL